MEKNIRVLVVDDSAFLRRYLPKILATDSDIEVVGAASNGEEAIEMVKKLQPDVITLDVVMPVMDGLTALKIIMREIPTPVVMVSSETHEGARATFEALALGAIDFVLKPSGPISLNIEKVSVELLDKIRSAYNAKIKIAATVDVTRAAFRALTEKLSHGAPSRSKTIESEGSFAEGKKLVAIAASTGGPAALQSILPCLPENLEAGIVIVQHIAQGFTRPLAERLNNLSNIAVREAQDGEPILPGIALISPAGMHLTVERTDAQFIARLNQEPADTLHRPSADVLFQSIARACAHETCAVILTGMGDDGAKGMRAIKDNGGWTVAQDEATSIIYGMPAQAVAKGGVKISLGLEQIPVEIIRATSGGNKKNTPH